MSFFTPLVEFESHVDRIKFILIWRLSIIFVFLFFALSFIFLFDSSETFIAYLSAFALSMTCLIYLHFKRQFQHAYILYTVGGSIIINCSILLILDSPHFIDFQWIMLGIFLGFFGLGARYGAILLAVNIAPIVYFFLFVLNDHLAILPLQSFEERLMLSVEITACYLCVGYIIYQLIKVQKLSEQELLDKNKVLKENNDFIKKSNFEKTILVKEIHHRVKNNLQIIISLLRLQMMEVRSSEAKKHFSEAINRALVMSSIHQKLYRQEEISQFRLDSYIEELATELKSFFKEGFPIELNIKTEFNDIDLKSIVPLGLLLNELISNSLKYAFHERESGKITIIVSDHNEYFELEYFDNGSWRNLQEDQSGFGLELIEMLTEQLNGEKKFTTNEEGTTYHFKLQKITENNER